MIKGMWLYSGSFYDDLIIIETEKNEPFIIDGEEVYNASIINNEHMVAGYRQESEYIEIDEKVYKLSELEVEERDRSNACKYYFIGTEYHSSIILENDYLLDNFQKQKSITKTTVKKLLRDLGKNKHIEVKINF